MKSRTYFRHTHVSFVFSWNDDEIKACLYETVCENFWKGKVFLRIDGGGLKFSENPYALRILTLLSETLTESLSR